MLLSACEPSDFGTVLKLSFSFRVHLPVVLVFADDVDAVSGLGICGEIVFLRRPRYVTYVTDQAIILTPFPGLVV